jgi:hypothetical protein
MNLWELKEMDFKDRINKFSEQSFIENFFNS